MKRRLLLVLPAVSLIVAACGESTSTDDGGGLPDGTTVPDGTTITDGTAPTDGTTQDVVDASDPFCDALAAYMARCGLTDQCNKDILAQCPAYGQVYNAKYQAAYVTCSTTHPCPADGGRLSAPNQCIAPQLSPPSAVALKLGTDVCALCDSAQQAQCEATIYAILDGGTYGVLYNLLQYQDSILNQINAQCVKVSGADAGDGGPSGCGQRFIKCAGDLIDKKMPPVPASCSSG